jgi:hypothetical protein
MWASNASMTVPFVERAGLIHFCFAMRVCCNMSDSLSVFALSPDNPLSLPHKNVGERFDMTAL